MQVFDGEAADDLPRLGHRPVSEIGGRRLLLPVLNKKPAQMFDYIEQGRAALFHENPAEKHAKRPHITAQGYLFRGVGRLGSRFSEAGLVVFSTP